METQTTLRRDLTQTRTRLDGQNTAAVHTAPIILADRPLPLIGKLDLSITVSTTVNLSAEDARRQVNRFVQREISYLMRGEWSSLVVADHIYWRVPVILTLSSFGAVGVIDVDVTTGELQASPDVIEEIQRRAQALAVRASPHTAPTG